MVEIVTFDLAMHGRRWEEFIAASYRQPNYVMLSPEFLRWQFLDNPANDTHAYTVWLAVHQGKVVGQLGFVPFAGIAPDGSRFTGAYPINLMVLPDLRAMGLGVIMVSRLLKQVGCLVNPGANEAGARVGEGLGMTDLGRLRRYVCITDPDAARAVALDGRLPPETENPLPAPEGRSTSGVIFTQRLPSGAPDRFHPPVPAFAAERSSCFFRWRYERHPAFSYEFLLSPDLRSVLVFHEEREKASGAIVFRIVDLLAQEADQVALLSAVVAAARTRGAAMIDFFCSLDCYDRALKAAGFFNEADHPGVTIAALFQPLDFRDASIRVIASSPPIQISAPWYITKADSDQDRPNDKNATRQHASA